MRMNYMVAWAAAACLSFASFAQAHTLVALAATQADATGAFSYNAVFTASSPVIIGGWSITGLPANNVNIGTIIADCFCPPSSPGCPVVPAVPFVISVAGSLLDSSQNGTVTVEVFLCDGETFQLTTTITPPEPPEDPDMPTVSEWGMATVMLLLLAGLTIKFGLLRSSRKAA